MPLLEEQVHEILEAFMDSLSKPEQELRRWVRHHLNTGEFLTLFAETFEPSDEFSDACYYSSDRS